ncbi:Lipase [Symbiodinium pilosum]|uniref:Lipase protein n=1 Tax=Symbiodinium pilosum TaxID=2952 RepID=A0A812N2N8_SYMPI|nr:Lipase [Symbiodinium pilosum]
MALALQTARRSSRDGPDGEADVAKPALRRPRHGFGNRHLLSFRKNQFSELVERTVDALKGNIAEASVEDVQNVLSKIRRQFDEVRCEADRKEAELVTIRQEIRFWESEAKPPEEQDNYNGFVRTAVVKKLDQASTELEQALETQRVYRHMVERLLREQRILQQKVLLMENYLDRKTREVEAKQTFSRRINEDKVEQIVKLEMLEQDMHLERMVCTTAISDLSAAIERRRHDVNQGEDFENWRYDIALEAATEAFEATAGRYRKIYAIEKLTGNCLQRLTFDQAEQSQATEDGFQRIREVTGLTDVMDIVHKFLNRDVEHEQLRNTVREAEARLHQLREEEASRPREDALVDAKPETRGLGVEVTEFEQMLEDIRQDHSDVQEQLKQSTLLIDSLKRWTQRLGKSLAPIQEMRAVQAESDLPRFFGHLVQVVHEFLERAHAEMPDARLVKVTSEATQKDFNDQGKLLHDKDFMRSNCRIVAAPDQTVKEDRRKKDPQTGEDERMDMEFANERERVKKEAVDRDLRTPKAKAVARGRARN